MLPWGVNPIFAYDSRLYPALCMGPLWSNPAFLPGLSESILYTSSSGSPTLQKVWAVKYFSNSVRTGLKELTLSQSRAPAGLPPSPSLQAEADSTPRQHSPAPAWLRRQEHQKGREGTEKV